MKSSSEIVVNPPCEEADFHSMFPTYLIFVFAAEALLLVHHFSVAVFVAYKLVMSDPHFRGGFFKIFLMQSVVEYVCFLEVGKMCDAPCECVPGTLFGSHGLSARK